MYNTKTRFILSLLVFLMIFNFTFEYKARAEAIALSAGFILFLKACYAAGITYIAGQKVAKVTQESMDLYKEWQKFVENKPPSDKPPKNWEKTVLGTLLGLQVGDSFMRLVDSVRDFFNELGAKKGENKYAPDVYFVKSGESVEVNIKTDKKSGREYSSVTLVVDSNVITLECYKVFLSDCFQFGVDSMSLNGTPIRSGHISGGRRKTDRETCTLTPVIEYNNNSVKVYKEDGLGGGIYSSSGDVTSLFRKPGDDLPPLPPVTNYYFEENSYQFTNNRDDIKPVYPNFSNFPKDKLVSVTEPNGNVTTYYPGTFDDLFNDWVSSQNGKNLFGDKPLGFTQTDNGIKIEDNSDTLPYDPNAPVENPTDVTTGLGTIIQLLKELINWSSNIFNKIPEEGEPIPEPEPDEDPLKLPEKVELDFSPLQGLLLTDRFPFCLPWDLKRSVEKLISPGAPPRWEVEIVTEEMVIDFAEFEALASISRAFFGLIYVCALVIITRRFISGA